MAGACAAGLPPRSSGAFEVQPAQRSTRPRTQTRQCRRRHQRLGSDASSVHLAPIGRWSPRPGALRAAGRSLPSRVKLTASVVLVEDLAQFAGEGFGFAGISRLAAHEAAVMAGEHRRLLTK